MAQIKARTVQTCVVFLPVPPLILMGFHQRGQNGRIFPPADRAAPAPTRHNWHHTSGTADHRICYAYSIIFVHVLDLHHFAKTT